MFHSMLGAGAGIRRTKMSDKKTVTISSEEYKSLLEDRRFLRALEAAGVDNWEGYQYAFEDEDEDEENEDEIES